MLRIGHISDSHLTAPVIESESYFPHYLKTLKPEQQQQFFDELNEVTRHAFLSCLEAIKRENPDFIVHHGDVTAGYKERGTMGDAVVEKANFAKKEMEKVAPSYVALGNHDTGYDRRSTLPGAELTREGLIGAMKAYGPPFWARKDGDLLSVGIATPVEEYEGKDHFVHGVQKTQRTFIADVLHAHRGDPWMLFSHDALSIDTLHKTFEPYIEDYKGMVHGDLHNPRSGELLKRFQMRFSKLHPTTRTMLRPSVLCPSTAPFGWRGYGYLSTTYENSKVSIDPKEASREGMPKNNPGDSALKHVWWVIRGKFNQLFQKEDASD